MINQKVHKKVCTKAKRLFLCLLSYYKKLFYKLLNNRTLVSVSIIDRKLTSVLINDFMKIARIVLVLSS